MIQSRPPIAKSWRTSLLVVGIVLAARSLPAESFKWTAPTPAELSMTSDPKAPGAAAIVLSYEETEDGETYEQLVHVRIKVLTEAGRDAAKFDIPSRIDSFAFTQSFYARTVHPGGSVVEFVSTSGNTHAKVFEDGETGRVAALSDVTVGSIVEYGYHLATNYYFNTLTRVYAADYDSPTWLIQNKYFTRSAHFSLKTPPRLEPEETRWVANLPAGAELKRSHGRVELDVADVPARPSEAFMPPLTSVVYNVRFFYFGGPREKFWAYRGGQEDDWWSNYDKPRKPLVETVNAMLPQTDNSEAKLRALYNAVQQFENTDLTRVRSHREDKQDGISAAKNSEDLWNRKRGNSEELTLLFIALARSANYDAFPMSISSRNHSIFNQDVLNWSQLNAMLAVVNLDGRDMFLDPGTAGCPFGHLAPSHSNVMGVAVEGKMIKVGSTPAQPAGDALTDRRADLTIGRAGAGSGPGIVTGTIKITWSGIAGLDLRRKAISEDEPAVRQAIEQQTQAEVPTGVEVKLQSLDGLANPDLPLAATLTVSGTLGVATSSRLLVPAQFFASNSVPLLVDEIRSEPIAFPAAYAIRDQVVLHLSDGLTVETLPQGRSNTLATDTLYSTRVETGHEDKATLNTERLFALRRIDYRKEEYPGLHKFFAQVASYDQDQIVLRTARASAGD